MRPGDFITYFFAGKYPYTGVVIKVWKSDHSSYLSTYEYTIEILENTGRLSVFDIHTGDVWNVWNETG